MNRIPRVLLFPLKGVSMQRVNEFVFYELAIKVHKLTELPNGLKYTDVWLDWSQSRDALNEIYRQRPLNFTAPVASKLYQAITSVVPDNFDAMIEKLPKPAAEGEEEVEEVAIPHWTISQIKEAATEFETVLRTECQSMDTYFISKKGTHSTKDLVENAHHQIPESVRNSVPQETRDDFDQAGKCMALDVPTAAAFHILRGTESVLRKYYELIVPGSKKASAKMRNWGVYIRLITAHDGDPKIVTILNHIKDVYRNPVLHPEIVFTDDMVQVLFGVCISAIVLVETEIRRIAAKGGLLPFVAPAAAGGTP